MFAISSGHTKTIPSLQPDGTDHFRRLKNGKYTVPLFFFFLLDWELIWGSFDMSVGYFAHFAD